MYILDVFKSDKLCQYRDQHKTASMSAHISSNFPCRSSDRINALIPLHKRREHARRVCCILHKFARENHGLNQKVLLMNVPQVNSNGSQPITKYHNNVRLLKNLHEE